MKCILIDSRECAKKGTTSIERAFIHVFLLQIVFATNGTSRSIVVPFRKQPNGSSTIRLGMRAHGLSRKRGQVRSDFFFDFFFRMHNLHAIVWQPSQRNNKFHIRLSRTECTLLNVSIFLSLVCAPGVACGIMKPTQPN